MLSLQVSKYSTHPTGKELSYNNNMSTRSTISLKTKDGYRSIYCHFDGYPDHNGNLLLDHYDTQEKVEELIALGSLSSLNKHPKPAEGDKHSHCHPAKGVTVAYARDRGERLVVHEYKTLDELADEFEDYNYIFNDGRWELLSLSHENNIDSASLDIICKGTPIQ